MCMCVCVCVCVCVGVGVCVCMGVHERVRLRLRMNKIVAQEKYKSGRGVDKNFFGYSEPSKGCRFNSTNIGSHLLLQLISEGRWVCVEEAVSDL